MLGWHHWVHWIRLHCIGLLRMDQINRLRLDWFGGLTQGSMGLDSTGLACIDVLLCLGWVGLGGYVQPKPIQVKPINLIQSKQTNAMQPNPMNPMMASKHSQGNRTNPSSQHNQSYQSKPPVQTSNAMTSIISNQSSQPIKINQIKHADNNPCSKTKHIGLDWM